MSNIVERRTRHLKRLEANHNRDFWARFGDQSLEAGDTSARLTDALSADWNRKQKGVQKTREHAVPPRSGGVLPAGWRKEHWKTQQAIAADYTGVQTSSKAEAIRVLEAYEQTIELPPAA